jgi:Holliday junction resolvasome RuvABC endonuclease subunit
MSRGVLMIVMGVMSRGTVKLGALGTLGPRQNLNDWHLMPKRQIIFALDPGSVNIGGAIIINGEPKQLFTVKGIPSRTKTNKGSFNDDMDALIKTVIPEFEYIITQNKVTHVVWETVPGFGEMNQRELIQAVCTALKVVTFQKGLFYNSLTPNYWHSQLLGRTKSVSKKEVREELLIRHPKLEKFVYLPPDPFDAAAIGIVAHEINNWKSL